MKNQERVLRCKPSQFKSDLTFNEWAEKYNVGRGYIPPTNYFQGNPSSGYAPIETESLFGVVLNNLIILLKGK